MVNDIKKTMKFMSQDARRATFKKWVFKDSVPCNADKMAEAGFIYTGTKTDPDSVKCFFCEKSLDGWEESDSPWEEHLNHSKNCEFAQIQMPQCCLTLEAYMKLMETVFKKAVDKELQRKIEQVEEDYENIEKMMKKLMKSYR